MTHIKSDKETLNGISVFQNTRVPIQNLFDYLVEGETITHFLKDFPTVTLQQVKQTLKDAELALKHRVQYDDYEMKDEYGFSDGIRGRFYQSINL